MISVEEVEQLCDCFESLPAEITNEIVIANYYVNRPISIPATSANIRLFYFITTKYSPTERIISSFEHLRFLLTSEDSTWNTLSIHEKIALVKKQHGLYNDVFVFQEHPQV
jgi:hypothetical protein